MQVHSDSGKTPSVYRFLDVEVDPVAASIFKAGVPVELRAKAFQVLLLLIRERHRVIGKEELFERAWPGTAVVDATLAGCIQEIRRGLADDAKNPRFIKTVPKLGYRFIAPIESEEPTAAEEIPVMAQPVAPQPWARWKAVAGVLGLAVAAAALFWMSLGGAAADNGFAEVAWWKLDEGTGDRVANSSPNGGLDGPSIRQEEQAERILDLIFGRSEVQNAGGLAVWG